MLKDGCSVGEGVRLEVSLGGPTGDGLVDVAASQWE